MASSHLNPLPPHYAHLPLDRSKKEIRLINLVDTSPSCEGRHYLLDDYNEPVICELSRASLDASPSFQALSYVWGQSHRSRKLVIRVKTTLTGSTSSDQEQGYIESEMSITDNLYILLLHAQMARGASQRLKLPIWADAVCINQMDDEEKSWQVQQMKLLYQSADFVYAWLGSCSLDEIEYIQELGNALRELVAEADQKSCSRRHCIEEVDYFSFPGHDRIPLFQEQRDLLEWVDKRVFVLDTTRSGKHPDGFFFFSLQYLEWLQSRPFWSRVWILQEVCLAKQIFFFCEACFIMDDVGLCAALRLIEKMMDILRNRIQHKYMTGHGWPMLQKRFLQDDDENELFQLLRWNYRIGDLKASFPHDYVFGLLGAATDASQLDILPDYSKQVETVYSELAVKWIKERGLDILALCPDTSRKAITTLPTWVPDFSSIPRFYSIWELFFSEWVNYVQVPSRGSNWGFEFGTSALGSTLDLRGQSCALVQDDLFPMQFTQETRPLDVRDILRASLNIVKQSATAYRGIEDRHMALMMTLVAAGPDLFTKGPAEYERMVATFNILIGPSVPDPGGGIRGL